MQQIKANVDIPEKNIKNVAHQSWLDGFSTLLIQHINTSTQVFTQTMEVQKMARKWSYGSQGLCTHPLMQTGGWKGDSGRQDFKISQSPKSAEIWAAKGRRMWWLTSAGVQNFIMASEFFLSPKPQSPLQVGRSVGVHRCGKHGFEHSGPCTGSVSWYLCSFTD